jgi:hypothetical protein
LVYDYFIDASRTFPSEFRNWTEVVAPFKYNKDVPFSQLMVPTVDTVRCGLDCCDRKHLRLHLFVNQAQGGWLTPERPLATPT